MLGITLQETRVYREIKTETTANIVVRQLKNRFGEISEELQQQISNLPLPVVEELSEALLDFTSMTDPEAWLEAR
jgi:predicted transposase YdaD